MKRPEQVQADRFHRAVEMLKTLEVLQVAPTVFMVPSQSNGTNYKVDVKAVTCECPDYRFRHSFCKHLQAVSMKVNGT